MFQLSDVPRPPVRGHEGLGVRAQAQPGTSVAFRQPLQSVPHQEGQVFRALPQRRDGEAEDGEAVEEVQEATVEAEVAQAEPVTVKGPARRTLEIALGLVLAPILGLMFVIFLPVIGFGALFWTLGQSLRDLMKPAHT